MDEGFCHQLIGLSAALKSNLPNIYGFYHLTNKYCEALRRLVSVYRERVVLPMIPGCLIVTPKTGSMLTLRERRLTDPLKAGSLPSKPSSPSMRFEPERKRGSGPMTSETIERSPCTFYDKINLTRTAEEFVTDANLKKEICDKAVLATVAYIASDNFHLTVQGAAQISRDRPDQHLWMNQEEQAAYH
jgi:hypothetical protein